MTYQAINLKTQARQKDRTVSTGGIKGINQLQAPEFVPENMVQNMENCFIENDGNLVKRNGQTLLFEVIQLIVDSWSYFSSSGALPKTWAEMETGGSFEKTWSDLET